MNSINADDTKLLELVEGLIIQFNQESDLSSINTPFCSVHNASLIQKLVEQNNLSIDFYGGYEGAYKFIGLIKQKNTKVNLENYGISVIKLEWARFEPIPKSRELKRLIYDYCPPSEVGDILVDGYVEIMLTNSSKARLIQAKSEIESQIKCSLTEGNSKTISHKFGALKNIFLSSNRLDAIVSKIYHLPRSESSEAITMGYIAVNNTREINTDRKVVLNSEIYFKGKGIYKIQEQEESKKGRICIKYSELITIQP